MLKVIGDLTVDANVRIFLNLFSSPALPDQIKPSGPGSGTTSSKL